MPRDGRRPPGGGRGERIRTSRACLSGARAALDLGNRVLHCWGSVTLRNISQHSLSSNHCGRELSRPLANLLGHHGVYFALLILENKVGFQLAQGAIKASLTRRET